MPEERWYSSGYGWLAIADSTTVRRPLHQPSQTTITLINPFSKAKQVPRSISLPSLIHHNLYCLPQQVPKVFLSDDPPLNPDNHVVLALVLFISISKVAFKKGRESNWTCLGLKEDDQVFTDAIFYKDQVYLAGCNHIVSFNLENERQFTTKGVRILPPSTRRAYLVESVKGDLWYVGRILAQRGRHLVTERFVVYKLVFDGFTVQPVELKSIGVEALFLGDNQSMSILSSQFPGCQANSIYYTDDSVTSYYQGSVTCDMGIFSLQDGKIRELFWEYSRDYPMPSPVWITPVFNRLR